MENQGSKPGAVRVKTTQLSSPNTTSQQKKKGHKKLLLSTVAGITFILIVAGFFVKNSNGEPILVAAYKRLILGEINKRKILIDPVIKARFDKFKSDVQEMKSELTNIENGIYTGNSKEKLSDCDSKCTSTIFELEDFAKDVAPLKADDLTENEIELLRTTYMETQQLVKKLKKKLSK